MAITQEHLAAILFVVAMVGIALGHATRSVLAVP